MRTFLTVILTFFQSASSLALINGRSLEGSSDIVRLEFTNGWICSGVFLDPETILTAGHCTSEIESHTPLHLKQVLTEGGRLVAVRDAQVNPHPLYSGQSWPNYDLGIVKTTRNQDFKGDFTLDRTSKKIRGLATLYGCGRTKASGNSLRRTVGENNFTRIGSVLFFIGPSVEGSSRIGTNVSIAPNDSGAPILDKKSGLIIAVATTTTAKTSESYGISILSTGTSVVTEENQKFILSQLKSK